jgi:predicted enzyme related to lactoylglutathione lyase
VTGEPSWFELGVGDVARARTFYGELFGWSFEDVAESDGAVIVTPGMRGGLHGGDKEASPLVFFRVDDLDAALERVRELGGEAGRLPDGGEPTPYGRFALCRDDQGSVFGLHQPRD